MRQTITALAILLACASAHGQSLMARNAAKAAERSSTAETIPQPSKAFFWYEFNDAAWPLYNTATRTNDGVQANSSYRPTISSGTASFDSNDYFVFAIANGITSGSAYAFWAKGSGGSGDRSALSTQQWSGGGEGFWVYVKGGTSEMWTRMQSVGDSLGENISSSTWNHYCWVFNGSTKKVRKYVNGAYKAEWNLGWSFNERYNGIVVGRYLATGYYWQNEMDEPIGYWGVVLTGAEVAQLYRVTNKGKR